MKVILKNTTVERLNYQNLLASMYSSQGTRTESLTIYERFLNCSAC